MSERERDTPTDAIEGLGDLLDWLGESAAMLKAAVNSVGRQWQGLQDAGGARDDHAASLLATLKPHLAELECFARQCRERIERLEADPFGRKPSDG